MVDILQNKGHFLFYGNSRPEIGAGHIMRLFALAQYAQLAGFKVSFLYKQCLPSHVKMLMQAGFGTTQISGLLSTEVIASQAPTHLVIDDYYLSPQEWQVLKKHSVFKILFDDALHMEPLYADLIVNASPSASLEAYKKRSPDARLCLGPKYTILRKEFRTASLALPPLQERNQVLILLGGTDVKHLSLPLCQKMLDQYPSLNLSAIVGECAPEYEAALRQLAKQYPKLSLYIKTDEVAHIMAQSGLAISSAGGSLSELACMNVPAFALVFADNQANALHSPTNNSWYKALDFRTYGQHNTIEDELMLNNLCSSAYDLYQDLAQRAQMQKQVIGIIDGLGCQRIIEKSMLQRG